MRHPKHTCILVPDLSLFVTIGRRGIDWCNNFVTKPKRRFAGALAQDSAADTEPQDTKNRPPHEVPLVRLIKRSHRRRGSTYIDVLMMSLSGAPILRSHKTSERDRVGLSVLMFQVWTFVRSLFMSQRRCRSHDVPREIPL